MCVCVFPAKCILHKVIDIYQRWCICGCIVRGSYTDFKLYSIIPNDARECGIVIQFIINNAVLTKTHNIAYIAIFNSAKLYIIVNNSVV